MFALTASANETIAPVMGEEEASSGVMVREGESGVMTHSGEVSALVWEDFKGHGREEVDELGVRSTIGCGSSKCPSSKEMLSGFAGFETG